MCHNCKAHEACDCTGGAVLTTCSCERGYDCPVCNHLPDTNVAAEPHLLIDILSADVIVGSSRPKPMPAA